MTKTIQERLDESFKHKKDSCIYRGFHCRQHSASDLMLSLILEELRSDAAEGFDISTDDIITPRTWADWIDKRVNE